MPVRGRRDLTGGDGLVLDRRVLSVVRGHTDNLSVPSTATRDRGDLWAVKAEFGTGDETFEVVRVDF